MRKLICVLLLVITLISSNFSIYAEDTTQTTPTTKPEEKPAEVKPLTEIEKKVNNSVEKLKYFKIIQGKEDGNFHPEQNIQRQEFAKIIVSAMKMESDLPMHDFIEFEDVTADLWSKNYIHVAVNIGFMKGLSDKKFEPTSQVSFAQAVTVMVRMLGYKDEYLTTSTWPVNYIAKAAELKILDGIEIKNWNEPVTRGVVALMLNNTMEVDFPKIREANHRGKNILEEKHKITKLEDITILSTDEKDLNKLMKVKFGKKTEMDGRSYEKDEEETFEFYDEFGFQKNVNCDVYILNFKKIIYQDTINIDGNYGAGLYISNSYLDLPKGKIQLGGKGEYIDVPSKAQIYLDGVEVKSKDFEKVLNNKVFGSFSYKSESLLSANLVSWKRENLFIVSLEKERFKILETKSGTINEYTQSYLDEKYDIFLVGNEGKISKITSKDLKPEDMICVAKDQENKDKNSIYVWRNKITGKMERVSGGTNGRRVKFNLAEGKGEFNVEDEFSYAYNGKDFNQAKDKTLKAFNDLSEFYNENIDLFKGWRDDIAYVKGGFNFQSNQYGIFMRFGDAVRGEIKIFTPTGSKTVYKFDETSEYDRLKEYTKGKEGQIIRYSISKAGKLKNLSENLSNDIIETTQLSKIKKGDDFSDNTVYIDGMPFDVDNNSKFFDYTAHNSENAKLLNWNKFKNKKVNSEVKVIYAADDGVLKALFIWENLDGIEEETIPGFVKDDYNLGDKRYLEIYSYDEINSKKIQIDEDFKNNYYLNRVFLYQISSDDKIKESKSTDEFEFLAGKVEAVEGLLVTIAGKRYRIVEDDCVIVENDKKATTSDISEGDLVIAYASRSRFQMIRIIKPKNSVDLDGTLMFVDSASKEDVFEVNNKEESYNLGKEEGIDFVFLDGYLKVNKRDADLTKLFEEKIGKKKPKVTVVFDEDTKKASMIFVHENME